MSGSRTSGEVIDIADMRNPVLSDAQKMALAGATQANFEFSTAVFLEINNFSVAHVSNDDVYELVMHIASSNPPLTDIVQRLRTMTGEMP